MRGGVFVFALVFIFILSFVSAGFFSDLEGTITGNSFDEAEVFSPQNSSSSEDNPLANPCIDCAAPPEGCRYEGGSCKSCGRLVNVDGGECLEGKFLEDESSEFSCSLIYGDGDPKKINLVFLPNKFEDKELFINDVSSFVDNSGEYDFFYVKPFDKYKDSFNFFVLYKDNLDLLEGRFLRDKTILEKTLENCSLINRSDIFQAVIFSPDRLRSNALSPGDSGNGLPYSIVSAPSFMDGKGKYAFGAFMHEIGHSLGDLADEYYESPVYQKDFIRLPYSAVANSDYEGCPKWCSGKLNKSSFCYPFYSSYLDCIYNSSLGDQECLDRTQDSLPEGFDFVLNCEMGSNCIEGTGCYFQANSMNLFRPSLRTIMAGNNAEDGYGVISEKHIEKRINFYLSQDSILSSLTNFSLNVVNVSVEEKFDERGERGGYGGYILFEVFDPEGNPLNLPGKINLNQRDFRFEGSNLISLPVLLDSSLSGKYYSKFDIYAPTKGDVGDYNYSLFEFTFDLPLINYSRFYFFNKTELSFDFLNESFYFKNKPISIKKVISIVNQTGAFENALKYSIKKHAFRDFDLVWDVTIYYSEYGGKTFILDYYSGEILSESNFSISEGRDDFNLAKNISLIGEEIFCDSGCFSEGKCFDYGYRIQGEFCSPVEDLFTSQFEGGAVCENNFECSSNVCVSGKCVDEGFLQKIINWFKSLF